MALVAGRKGGDAPDVQAFIGNRLELGQERYGDLVLAEEHRHILQESLEEILDAIVYLVMGIVGCKLQGADLELAERILDTQLGCAIEYAEHGVRC